MCACGVSRAKDKLPPLEEVETSAFVENALLLMLNRYHCYCHENIGEVLFCFLKWMFGKFAEKETKKLFNIST
jgi:hypothetical protein